jgi:lipoyl(octanoyl) transferase
LIPPQTHCTARATEDKNVIAPESWYCLESGRGDPAFNMALDEALIEATPTLHQPVLRFYGWTQPAASFGYFQKYREVEQLTPLRPLVRRPTGGGIVPHDADWTYSLIFPPGHTWYGLSATDSYRHVHLWIQMAFERLNLLTELAPIALKAHAGQCFVGHEQADLLWNGRKIAGAAQRRRRDGLLIQGSVQPPSSGPNRMDWEQAMRDVATSAYAVVWEECLENVSVKNRAKELAESKYSQSSYNQHR